MSVTLYMGKVLTKDDLNIYLLDENGRYFNPFSITYDIYHVLRSPFEGNNKNSNPPESISLTINGTAPNLPNRWRNEAPQDFREDRVPGKFDEDGDFIPNPNNGNGCHGRGRGTTTLPEREWYEEPYIETLGSMGIPFGTGMYFAAWKMPIDIIVGRYRIKWHVRRFPDSPVYQEIEEFDIYNRVDKYNYALMNGANGNLPHNEYGNETLWAG